MRSKAAVRHGLLWNARNRRHKQKGDAVQSVAKSVDTVKPETKERLNSRLKCSIADDAQRSGPGRSGQRPWPLTLRRRRNGGPLLVWPPWSLDKPSKWS
ncbi:hypothetical protein LMG24238_05553 [Paraburkholderia sediminicola]|uniref:Uncharacterized protein n=1 Tax=Paraburkholderia sediminicola TaxID=458836 RepID=A0A6J5C6U7_9BURK|nr:hypothetical protein LMG24238_05553 [Paraburkholderia sediminicola]